MKLAWLQLGVCVLFAAAACTAGAVDAKPVWQEYTDSNGRWMIHYPDFTHPEQMQPNKVDLLAEVAFGFEQPFGSGPDAGSLKFRVLVSTWHNSGRLTTEEWARQRTDPNLTSDFKPVVLDNRPGVMLRTTNMAWSMVMVFITDGDRVYELSYTDIVSSGLLPSATQAYWTDVFDHMLKSFRLL
jgi:hypothetical protein